MQPTRIVAGFLLVCGALIISDCKRNSEALASFDGGEITRGDLRMIFKLSQGPNAEKAATIKAQDNIIRQLALVSIASKEATKAGFDKDPFYVEANRFLEKRAALETFQAYLRLHSDDHEFEMMEVQHLLLRQKPPAGAKGGEKTGEPTEDRSAEARALLAQLNKAGDDEIEKLVREKTDLEMYKPVAGYEIPICVSCSMNPQREITDKLKLAKKGEFVHLPGPGGHTLVRQISTKKVAASDLKDFFEKAFKKQARIAIKYMGTIKDEKLRKSIEERIPTNEKQITARAEGRAQFISREIAQLSRTRYFKIREEKKVMVHPAMQFDAKIEYKDDTKLFTIAGKDYSYGDLKKELPGEMTAEARMKNAGLWMDTTILADDEMFKKAQKSNLYPFLVKTLRSHLLAQTYFRKTMGEPDVSAKKIQDAYTMGQTTRFKGKSLASVRADIAKEIADGEKRAMAKQLQDDLGKKHNLRIFSDKLTANSL